MTSNGRQPKHIKNGISQQPIFGSYSNFKLKLKWKMTSKYNKLLLHFIDKYYIILSFKKAKIIHFFINISQYLPHYQFRRQYQEDSSTSFFQWTPTLHYISIKLCTKGNQYRHFLCKFSIKFIKTKTII